MLMPPRRPRLRLVGGSIADCPAKPKTPRPSWPPSCPHRRARLRQDAARDHDPETIVVFFVTDSGPLAFDEDVRLAHEIHAHATATEPLPPPHPYSGTDSALRSILDAGYSIALIDSL